MDKTIKVKVSVDRQLFYDSSSMYGVYAMSPIESEEHIPLNSYGNFVVNGTTPELSIGEEYDIEIVPEVTEKYGNGFKIVSVEVKRPQTVYEQQEYVKSLVTDLQYKEIIKQYPNHLILDIIEDGTFDYSNMRGIKEATYQNIRRKLVDNLEIHEALVELKDLNMTFDAMKRLVSHFGSAELVVQRVKDNIYSLCEADGFGFKTVDDYALSRGDDRKSVNRIESAVHYVLENDADSGHSWMTINNLNKKVLEVLEIDKSYVDEVLADLKKNGRGLYFDENRVALAHNHFYEESIKDKLYDMISQEVGTANVTGVEEKIAEQEKTLGFDYTDEQKKAITKAIENNVLVINGFGGTGKCLLGDSLVYTDKGILKIEDIPKHYEVGANGEVSTSIVSYKTNGEQEVRNTSHWFNMGLSKTIRIETSQGFEIEGTPEHPLLVMDENGDLEYKELQHITTSDIVSVSKENNLWGNETNVSNNLAYIMGVLTGDGSLTTSKTQNRLSSFFNKTDSSASVKPESNFYLPHNCHGKHTADLMESLGMFTEESKRKEIPQSILQSPRIVNIAFLQGLFETNVHTCEKSGFEYHTASNVLAKQIHIVLLNLGIVSKLKVDKSNQKDSGHYEEKRYIIQADGKYAQKLHELRLFGYDKNYSFKSKDDLYTENVSNNLFFDKIVSVTHSEEKKVVYDFTVPETHSFVANGIVNHNTAIVKGVTKALSDYDYMTCSLSGKATQVLSKHGLKSMTIHRMLGFNPEGGFVYNEHNPLPYDIVVIDEASMVNSYLIYSVLMALKEGAKIIFVGDNGQLPSIGTGAVFDSLIDYGHDFQRQELTTIHRQAQKSGILSAANEIRSGRQIGGRYDHTTQLYGELKDMALIPLQHKEHIKEQVLDICKGYAEKDLFEFQVITGLRERGDISVKELNIELQSIFNDLDQPCVSRGGYDYRVGDKVIQNGNNYNIGEDGDVSVFNGTIGIISKIEFDSDQSRQNHLIHIEFEGIDEVIIYEKGDMSNIELAYAITVHRSQGSTIKHVLFTFDFGSYMLLSKEFVYTGITRASDGCIVVAENAALHYAIEQTTGGARRDFLKEMLQEHSNK